VTAKDTSAASSAQTWVPNDAATVVSASSTPGHPVADLNGTLTLQLFASSDCTGSAIQTYTMGVSNAATATITSNNSTYVVSGAGPHTVSWLVTFTSSDPNVANTSHCELTSLTITN
jgi:hypothetical protein